MTEQFSIPQDKKEEVRGFIDEMDELLELASEALQNENREEALEQLMNTSTAAEQIDEVFDGFGGYNDVKDFWRSGIQAAREGRLDEAIEDIRNFLEQFR